MKQIKYETNAVKAFDCIGNGWNLAGQNYGLFFGATFTLIVFIIIISLIPVLSLILEPIVVGPLTVGLYYVYLRKFDGEPANIGMIFSGFRHFIPAAVLSFVISAPFLVSDMIQVSIDYGLILPELNNSENLQVFEAFNIIYVLMWLAAFFIYLVIHLLLYFTFLLIAEHDLGAMDAAKLSVEAAFANLSGLIALIILQVVLMLAGVLVCLIGVFFILPAIYAADVLAYRRVFPKTNLSFQNEPPPPNVYDESFGSGQ